MFKENSREKFRILAEKRVVKAIKDLRLIGNLANKKNYTYEKKEADKIISALEKEIRSIKQKFEDDVQGEKIEFKL
jgi:hypothetical protein